MKQIDLYLLFSLYDLAEFNPNKKVFDTVR